MSSLFPALTEALPLGSTKDSADGPAHGPAQASAHGPADRPALRFGDRSLTYAELAAAADTLAHRLTGHGRVAVWATADLETARRRGGRAAGRCRRRTAQPEVRRQRARRTSSTTARPPWCSPRPATNSPPPWRTLTRVDVGIALVADADVAAAGPLPDTARVRRGPRPDRLHLRHHRPAQGRGAPPPRDRRHARRAGGRLAVDRRRRAGARAAAVPRARPDPRHPRPAAARRHPCATSAGSARKA